MTTSPRLRVGRNYSAVWSFAFGRAAEQGGMILTDAGKAAIGELSQKHGFSPEAVTSMLRSLVAGHFSMAQFQHAEFAGSGQWMRGGMIMISDMFNNGLKARIDGLCYDLVALSADSAQLFKAETASNRSVSLVVPGSGAEWWGADLGHPSSTGSQNSVRYAWFPSSRRLAIDTGVSVTVYDTQDHQIGGFSQQQSHGATLLFTSQYGTVDVGSLPVVGGGKPTSAPERAPDPQESSASQRSALEKSLPPDPTTHRTAAETAPSAARPAAEASPNASASQTPDIFVALEKLAALHAKGILTDQEFSEKKADLLSRL